MDHDPDISSGGDAVTLALSQWEGKAFGISANLLLTTLNAYPFEMTGNSYLSVNPSDRSQTNLR
jgi:hypothetical protein